MKHRPKVYLHMGNLKTDRQTASPDSISLPSWSMMAQQGRKGCKTKLCRKKPRNAARQLRGILDIPLEDHDHEDTVRIGTGEDIDEFQRAAPRSEVKETETEDVCSTSVLRIASQMSQLR